MVVEGRTVLSRDSPVVWFTFPGLWHDVGRFHAPDGAFTALYANVLTPMEISGDEWRTTDLFLDVLLEPGRKPRMLDEEELAEAVRRGWLGASEARRAEAEAERLIEGARSGAWPPPVVGEWPIERARAVAEAGTPAPTPVYPRRRP